jgi:hypothetical protein
MGRRTVTLDSELLKKVRNPIGLSFRFPGMKKIHFSCNLMKNKAVGLSIGFFIGAVMATFCHDGLVEAAAKVLRQFVNLIIAINFDGFLGGV